MLCPSNHQSFSSFRGRGRSIFHLCCFPSTLSHTELSSERPELSYEYPVTGLKPKRNTYLEITFEMFERFCSLNLIAHSLTKKKKYIFTNNFFLLRCSVKIQKILWAFLKKYLTLPWSFSFSFGSLCSVFFTFSHCTKGLIVSP